LFLIALFQVISVIVIIAMPQNQSLFLHNVAGLRPQAIRQNAHGSGLFRIQLQHPTTIKNQPIEFVRLTTGQQWQRPLS
jgi:hypothetical protein